MLELGTPVKFLGIFLETDPADSARETRPPHAERPHAVPRPLQRGIRGRAGITPTTRLSGRPWHIPPGLFPDAPNLGHFVIAHSGDRGEGSLAWIPGAKPKVLVVGSTFFSRSSLDNHAMHGLEKPITHRREP
jgi:hypothetical protein